jgi:Protein of unknown function (DUF3800)
MAHSGDDTDARVSADREAPPEENAKTADKRARLEREKQELLASLAGGDFSTMKTKVAGMLNLYPDTRNSDVALSLKYWETFQPEIYNPHGIHPRDLFKLERLHYIVRARAKIQNEYGLFQADDKIRGHRKGREEEMHEAVVEDAAPRRVVFIYADETGKTQDYVIVAAVWVLTGYAVFTVSRAIDAWKSASAWSNREVHFSRLGKGDSVALLEYLRVIQANREFLSFKVIAIDRARTRRSIEEIVIKLHEHMLIRGTEHEVKTGRIELPREFELTVDEEDSLDSFNLEEMRRRVNDEYERSLDGKAVLASAKSASSRRSDLIQLADLIAGAVNRRLNPQEGRNHKDDMADRIIEELGLSLEEEHVPGLDAAALFRV